MKEWRVGTVTHKGSMIAWANMDTTKPVLAHAIAPNGLRIDIPREFPQLTHLHIYVLWQALWRDSNA